MKLSEYKAGDRIKYSYFGEVRIGTVIGYDDCGLWCQWDSNKRIQMVASSSYLTLIPFLQGNDETIKSLQPSYVKVVKDNIAYYYFNNKIASDALTNGTALQMTANANFVVDLNTDKLLKSRASTESIIDKYTGV